MKQRTRHTLLWLPVINGSNRLYKMESPGNGWPSLAGVNMVVTGTNRSTIGELNGICSLQESGDRISFLSFAGY